MGSCWQYTMRRSRSHDARCRPLWT